MNSLNFINKLLKPLKKIFIFISYFKSLKNLKLFYLGSETVNHLVKFGEYRLYEDVLKC